MKIFREAKIIWRYLKPYKRKVYGLVLIAIFGSLIAAAIPYIYGQLVDLATNELSSLVFLASILLLWLFLALLGDWMNRLVDNQGSYIAVDASNDMLLRLTSHLLDLPLNFHKHKKMGEIIQRTTRGSDYLEMIIEQAVFKICPSFLTVIGALVIMSLVEWHLALLLFVVLLFYSLASIWKTKSIIQSQKKMNKYFERAYGDLYDSVLNIETVKSFTREELEKKKTARNFADKAGQHYKHFMKLWRDLAAWQQSIFSFGFVLIFGSAIYLLRENIISPGQLVMFMGYISLAYAPFGRLAENYRLFRTGLATIQRSLKTLKVKTEPYQGEGRVLKNIQGAVEFDNVSFRYDKGKKVLSDINFKVKPGEIVALVGESGVGKTTIVDLISGYYKPAQGKVRVDDHDIQDVTIESLRRNIALVPQEVTLFNDTIRNNIGYGKIRATDKEIVEEEKTEKSHQFIKKFEKK